MEEKMKSIEARRNFYLVGIVGSSFMTGTSLVKMLKNLSDISLTEISVVFLLAICTGICSSLYSEASETIKKNKQ